MIYRFEDYELDTALFELRHGGQPCKLEPQVFTVLAYLIEHRDHVVTKGELLDYVWPEQFVSEVTLHHRLMAARKAVGDSGRAQRLIKTLHGRGYHFIAKVTTISDSPSEVSASPTRLTSLAGTMPSTAGKAPADVRSDSLGTDHRKPIAFRKPSAKMSDSPPSKFQVSLMPRDTLSHHPREDMPRQ